MPAKSGQHTVDRGLEKTRRDVKAPLLEKETEPALDAAILEAVEGSTCDALRGFLRTRRRPHPGLKVELVAAVKAEIAKRYEGICVECEVCALTRLAQDMEKRRCVVASGCEERPPMRPTGADG